MDKITKEYIEQQAPDLATVKNAVSLCKKNSFIMQSKTENEDLFFAECKGSGKSIYKVSVDFSVENKPVFRCSCPSRKLPCKHSIGILQDIFNGTTYEIAEIPQDILVKREKAVKRQEKKLEDNVSKPKKVNKSAKLKKMKKQLEGLDIGEKLVNDILEKGISTIDAQATSIYTEILKEFGNCYLTGLQEYMQELIMHIEVIKIEKKSGIKVSYSSVMETLIKFNSLLTKSREYLEHNIKNEIIEDGISEIFEKLGSKYTLEQLNEFGLKKDNAKLIQIGFYVEDLKSNKEFVDVGYFCDLDNGNVNPCYNYRPYKAMKYINEEEIIFDIVKTETLSYYPAKINQRIRFDKYELEEITKEDIVILKNFGNSLGECIKLAKNYLKNTLSSEKFPVMISYNEIGINANNELVLKDKNNEEIIIYENENNKFSNLRNLPSDNMYKNQVLFGELFYDKNKRNISIIPLSVIAEEVIFL